MVVKCTPDPQMFGVIGFIHKLDPCLAWSVIKLHPSTGTRRGCLGSCSAVALNSLIHAVLPGSLQIQIGMSSKSSDKLRISRILEINL